MSWKSEGRREPEASVKEPTAAEEGEKGRRNAKRVTGANEGFLEKGTSECGRGEGGRAVVVGG